MKKGTLKGTLERIMKVKTAAAVLFLAGLLLITGTPELTAQSICIDSGLFRLDAPESLKQKLKEKQFDPSKLRKKLVETVGDYFLAGGLDIGEAVERCDFQLQGTVEVEDHLDGTDGFSLVFSANSLRIVPAGAKKYLPVLTFRRISGNDHPRMKSSHSTKPNTAVEGGIQCFVEQMEETGIFLFMAHPLYGAAVFLDLEKLENTEEQGERREEFSMMLERFKKDVRNIIRTEVKAAIGKLKPASGTDYGKDYSKDYSKDFQRVLKRIQQLENLIKKKKDIGKEEIKRLKAMAAQLDKTLAQMKEDYRLVNYIIVYINVPSNLPEEFMHTVIKPETCKNCSEPDIKAENITELSTREDIELLDQNAHYGYPLTLTGTISVNGDTVTLTLSEAGYNRIFELNSDNNLDKPDELMNGIKDRANDNPRLFIMDMKEKERMERKNRRKR